MWLTSPKVSKAQLESMKVLRRAVTKAMNREHQITQWYLLNCVVHWRTWILVKGNVWNLKLLTFVKKQSKSVNSAFSNSALATLLCVFKISKRFNVNFFDDSLPAMSKENFFCHGNASNRCDMWPWVPRDDCLWLLRSFSSARWRSIGKHFYLWGNLLSFNLKVQ